MTDVDEIIDYIKSLKKGFDKDLFQNKVDELAYAVDTTGIEYNDFHTLLKVWLNLSIPITKWVSLGVCLVPQGSVEERTVEYALSWILSNYEDQSSFSRIGFLLDWLTAAMECECIDMDKLDLGYDVFYVSLTYEALTPHAMKLVYTLTKPSDVTRRRVLELLDYAKKREAKKNMYRQLQVLLGLFKSYKPECVPEDVPAISIHTAFKKINVNLLARFKRNQQNRNTLSKEKLHLTWINPINSERGRNAKADPLVPNMEFFNIGSRQNTDKEPPKTFLDFTDPVSVVQCGLHKQSSRPARLRALLCNATGVALLAVASRSEQAFLSHDLHHLLNSCFLDVSPHSYMEKQDLLHRLAVLQHTLMQGIPVITRFLAQYLPLWNEKDYFAEILELVQWVSVDSPDHAMCVVEPLTRIYHRAQPIEQCAILKSLNTMYSSLMYCSTRTRQHFMGAPPPENYEIVLPKVADAITDLCNKALQVNPDDMRVLHSTVSSATHRARSSVCSGAAGGVQRVAPLSLALPLVSVSAALVDSVAELLILYRKTFSILKTANKLQKDDSTFTEQMDLLQAYTSDMINCLYSEETLTGRKTGFVFEKLHPQLVSKLGSLMPDVDSKLSIRNSIAFSPYTYIQLDAIDHRDADNKLWFSAVIDQEFSNLSRFLKKAVPELRYQ
ncbi:centromere protein I-like [Anticarsia gemmatalis]|uniref:centromere protein I-like n=1 Tax=Anticarsia gemmatalis TaxID=129554 RepID=UPI003F776FEF